MREMPLIRRIGQGSIVAVVAAALLTLPMGLPASAEEEVVISATTLQGFSPKTVDARTGTTIVWRNDEVASPNLAVPIGKHQIVADDGSFESPVLVSKASWSLTFNEPGSFAYHCSIHPQLMTGSLAITGPVIKPEPLERTVKIVEPDADPSSWGYKPETLVVKRGTTVTWRNEGAEPHTVTDYDGRFDSGNMAGGEKFSFTFKGSAGVRYYCTLHEWMTGVVRIAGAEGPPPPPPAKNTGTNQPQSPQAQQRTGSGPTTFGVNVVEPDASDPDSWGFAPPHLTARVGDTVRWTNTGSTTHTVTSDGGAFDSGNLDPGATFEFVLPSTGTLTYHCTPHPWMTGTLVVRAASAAVPDQPRGGTSPPVAPPPDTTTEEPGEPAVDGDAAAADRRALAFAAGAAIVVLGAAFIVPVILDRRRRTTAGPAQIDLTDARAPLGVGRPTA